MDQIAVPRSIDGVPEAALAPTVCTAARF